MGYKIGDRVRFLGVNTGAPERVESDVTGVEGAWSLLKPGAIGTVNEVLPLDETDSSERLFVNFEGVGMPFDDFALLLGMPTGWPILASEVEAVTEEAAA